ncbi:MAG: hypothetical protein HYY17_10905 [Planctomycetes bacterium]|nr:hypothetical protein [Planctomycetota bacterium]
MRRLGPLLLFATACAPQPRPDGGEDLVVAATIESPAIEGEIGTFRVRIRNATRSYVILRDLAPRGSETASASWQVSLPGRIEYQAEPDSFLHDRKARGPSAPLFNRGLLVPGEEVSFRTRLRLLDLPRAFVLRYYSYSLDDVSKRVYFEKRGEQEVRYVRRFGKDIEDRLARSGAPDAASHRTVLFPYAEQVAARPLERGLELTAALKPRPFTLEQARAKTGIAKEDERTFYAELELWALRSGGRCVLAGPQRVVELPRMRNMTGLFHLMDVLDHPKFEVEFQKETKTLFADDYALVASGGKFLAFVPRTDFLGFLERVRAFDLAVDAELRPEGGGRILVTR